ncbi:MAG: sulfite exporter TauE/SafE family protein, partial [Rickettsiaceae bacterium]|nr:sulfite exporter TauE/SafE family protein [Rickettsiaceae bacterium]
FLIPSLFSVFCSRHFIVPNLPNFLFGVPVNKLLISLLVLLMIFAGYFMVKKRKEYVQNEEIPYQRTKILIISLSLGIVMGLLAGGGFLVIPILMFLMHFSIKEAIPTSIFIITVNSFVGFCADKHNLSDGDWADILGYLSSAFLGMITGLIIAKFVDSDGLKKIFAYFLWAVAAFIFTREFII